VPLVLHLPQYWCFNCSCASVPAENEPHARAARLASWARNKSSDVQLTGAHVPLTPEQVAEIEGRKESHHKPVPLGKQVIQTDVAQKLVKLERYSFLDDGKKVKLYIELENIGALEDRISCTFDVGGFNLVIKDDESSRRQLAVDNLSNPIIPEKSKITVKPNKIIVTLFKEVEKTWYSLKKT